MEHVDMIAKTINYFLTECFKPKKNQYFFKTNIVLYK